MIQQTSAPAKVILFGEHAVVYGVPAIAVPVSSLRAYATVEPSENRFTIITNDLKQDNIALTVDLNNDKNPLTKMVTLIFEHFNISTKPSVNITLNSDIPIASGLGSGAAISTALGRAITISLQQSISDDTLNQLVYEVEKLHHGTPSGIDNTVIVHEMPISFQRFPFMTGNYTSLGKQVQYLQVKSPIHIVVGDTGQTALTHESVGDVRKLKEANPSGVNIILHKIDDIVKQVLHCLTIDDKVLLGRLMTENHEQLQKLTVSSPKLDELVTVALEAGALGAKLSGSGRGGNMIALVEETNIQQVKIALQEAGAVRVFDSVVR